MTDVPMTAAERMRLWRQRQREGKIVLPGGLAVPEDIAQRLVDLNFLPCETEDPTLIKAAIERLIANISVEEVLEVEGRQVIVRRVTA